MSNPYYAEYLNFLYEGGRKMAEAFPRVANHLAEKGLDPDVERLLEGLAFFVSKIGRRQTQSLDQICQLIFEILFPHYLCPLPAASIVQLQGRADDRRYIERGTEVLSVPVLGTACRFQTVYDVPLEGLSLDRCRWDMVGSGAQLTLSFSGKDWLATEPTKDSIRIFLQGEPLTTRSLYRWLLTACESIDLLDQNGNEITRLDGTPQSTGLSPEECLFFHPQGSFGGFRLLQEYFALPEKFMFIRLANVWKQLPQSLKEEGRFGLRFSLRAEAPSTFTLSEQNFLLNCTPVVNLFSHTADPIQRTMAKIDYRLRPAGPHLHYEIYRILKVTGMSRLGTIHYPLLSEIDLNQEEKPFCQIYRDRFRNEPETLASFFNGGGETPPHETILTDIYASNGKLPEGLRVGDLRQVAAPHARVKCQNIVPVSKPAMPPAGETLRHRLISHLALSQRDLTERQAIRTTLDLYNFHAMQDKQIAWAHNLLLDGILEAEGESVQHRYQKVPIWGRSTVVTLDESAFDNEGELYLFGCILNEFVALQSPLNLFSQFGVRGAKSQDIIRWPKRLAQEILD
jgi:type VI secretion system protein ImpG